jgi:citrate synthase
MLLEIKSPDRLEGWLDNTLRSGEKVMGFGHRVYKEGDPRAKILKTMSREITRENGHPELYEMSARLEELMQQKKGLIPNVDFYSESVYYSMGIPIDLFTPVLSEHRSSC